MLRCTTYLTDTRSRQSSTNGLAFKGTNCIAVNANFDFFPARNTGLNSIIYHFFYFGHFAYFLIFLSHRRPARIALLAWRSWGAETA